jgi:hypothetical protein
MEEENGKGTPLTEQERAARHFGIDISKVTPEMVAKLPPRRTGLENQNARGTDGVDITSLAIFFLYHSMPHMDTASSPGIVIDPEIAASSPCKCARVNGSEICFSHGIVGGLDEEQKKLYCRPKTFFESPGLEARIGQFKEAVVAAQEKIKDIPKGQRLEPWLLAMSEELGKRGIAI